MNEPYFLSAPTDGRDATKDIQAALDTYGACLLGAGDFTVTGVTMPERATLSGLGAATHIHLADTVTSGAAVRLSSYCTVKDIAFYGSTSEETPAELGERHGILFEGNVFTDNDDHAGQDHNNIITNCFFFGFSGGCITCRHTGYSVKSCVSVSDCHMRFSGAGINIERFSEFSKFTNITSTNNLYGCINNGGNNMFVNCGFSANTVGFLIDNEHGQSPNCAHGSCVGCTFHHSDKNRGIGILIKNEIPGFVFDGCQIGFSKIVIENSNCVSFVAMNFLRHVAIRISGGTLTLFASSMFHEAPEVTIENNDAVRFDNCYLKDGTPFDPTKSKL